MKKIMWLWLVIVSWNAQAQQATVESTLSTMKDQIVKNKGITVNDRVVYTAGNEPYVLPVMQSWMKDSLLTVRSNAVVITGRLASFTISAPSRIQAMDMLFKACGDRDAGIGSLAAEYLREVKWNYFTSTHKTAIGLFLNERQAGLGNFLYLAGYMYASEQTGAIRQLIASGKLRKNDLWQAHLALARMGDRQSIRECISIANSVPLGKDYLNIIVPGLIYTRQKACTDVLAALLKDNEKACIPSNPNYSQPIPCRYRIVEALATVIADFPVKVNSSGDLVNNDYEGALQTSIQWFGKHPDYKFTDN